MPKRDGFNPIQTLLYKFEWKCGFKSRTFVQYFTETNVIVLTILSAIKYTILGISNAIIAEDITLFGYVIHSQTYSTRPAVDVSWTMNNAGNNLKWHIEDK